MHSMEGTRDRRLILKLPFICALHETLNYIVLVQLLGRRFHLLSLAYIVLKVPYIYVYVVAYACEFCV